MEERRIAAVCALLVVALAGAPDLSAGDAPLDARVRLSVGSHYSTGDYGTSSATDILYVPFTVRAEIGRWTLRSTVPYLWIRSAGGVVEGPAGPVLATAGTSDGLGDVLVRGSYLLASARTWIPYVELAGVVKFPTASRTRGLGTGEYDFGIESDLTWSFDPLTPFATVGYRFLGDRPSARLRDVFLGSFGAQYRLRDPFALGLMLDYRQAASSSSGERVELIPFGSYRVRSHWLVGVYASAGLADGSPDAGVGVELGYTL